MPEPKPDPKPDLELQALTASLARLLRPTLERSAPLREALSTLGRWLISETARAEAATPGPPTSVEGPDRAAEPSAQGTGRSGDTDVHQVDAGSAGAAGFASGTFASSPSSGEADAVGEAGGEPTEAAASTPSLSSDQLARSIEAPVTGQRVRVTAGFVPLKIGDAEVHHLRLAGTTEELGRARQAAQHLPGVENGTGAEPGDPSEFLEGAFVDFRLVERRCRLKARSCRHFIRRRTAARGSAAEREATEVIDEMITTAKALPSCFLWVYWRERTQPDDALLELIADNYDALAEAAALVTKLEETSGIEGSELERPMLEALAQAHSALRAVLSRTWLSHDDHDQLEVHRWLKHWTATRRIFVERHMSLADPADPAEASTLRVTIARLSQAIDQQRSRAKAVLEALGRIRYHAGKITDSAPDEAAPHWSRIGQALASLAEIGVFSTDRRILEAIGPQAAAAWCEEHASAVEQVVVQRVLAGERTRARPAPRRAGDEPRAWDSAVLRARELLRGGHVVVIGGLRKGRSLERLREAFDLASIEWVALAEHGPSLPMQAPIRRSDTRVVLVIIKLTGHLHAGIARQLATEAGKPWVLLTGGYNPSSVAAAVLQQASERLGGAVPAGAA